MTASAFLDTSVLIRYLSGDDAQKADRSERLLRDASHGRTPLCVTHLVIAELVWVLSKEYRMPRTAIAEHLQRLLTTPHVACAEAEHLATALELFASTPLSFVDAYHAVLLPARGITTFYSYDTDFDQLPGLTRREP
ncbi:MAG: hypothetical protein A3C53_07770 [Omnitrophica WOR_2 bacterium RIFCSPHIGHO2_02_FULL_68_15]|nr:MAG: hypothetical protein A3C53_07770 [Omnitrophica WOR_2 bacterium RIFCSPHIGHO2_02_FULL_68_15]